MEEVCVVLSPSSFVLYSARLYARPAILAKIPPMLKEHMDQLRGHCDSRHIVPSVIAILRTFLHYMQFFEYFFVFHNSAKI